MIRSIYTAAANMVAQLNRQTILANNIANVDTPGYKQDLTVIESFSNMMLKNMGGPQGGETLGSIGTGVMVPQVSLDLSQGELVASSRPLDVGLSGPGFFAVQTADGMRYTRAGIFQRDASGALTTTDGGQVLGQNGPVRLPVSGDLRVMSDGRILVNDQEVDRFQLVEFAADVRLRKTGHSYVTAEGVEPVPATRTSALQGTVEQSNVDVSRAMSEMTAGLRAYQANQQVIQLQDQTLEQAINEVGRVLQA